MSFFKDMMCSKAHDTQLVQVEPRTVNTMPRLKNDFLKECMSDPAIGGGRSIPIDEFNRSWCVRCQQKDCGRAGLNNSLLVRRAETWKEKLFDKPPRADDADSRFDHIRAKRFLPTQSEAARQPVPAYEVRPANVPAMMQSVEELVEPEEAEIPDGPDTEPELENPPSEPAPLFVQPAPQPVAPAPQPVRQPAPAQTQNTPFEQGMMIGGKAPPQQQSQASDDQVVEVGGTYVFGSDE